MNKDRYSSLVGGVRSPKVRRFRRKNRGRSFVVPGGLGRQERRHGWGYIKRRAVAEGY